MDWRYFLSATAQSMASILGIFGALLVALALSEIREQRENKYRLKDLLAEAKRMVANMHPLERHLKAFLNRRKEENKQNFSRIHNNSAITTKEVKEYLQKLPDRIYEFEDNRDILQSAQDLADEFELSDTDLEPMYVGPDIRGIADEIKMFRADYQNKLFHVRSIKSLEHRIMESHIPIVRKIAYTLPFAMLLLVILPLLFIPPDPSNSALYDSYHPVWVKVSFPIAAFLLVFALSVYVLVLTRQVLPSDEVQRDVSKYGRMKAYSSYYEIALRKRNDRLD